MYIGFESYSHPGYKCHRSYLTEAVVAAFGTTMAQKFTSTCCPAMCADGSFSVDNGHCVPIAKKLDHACWRDEQCYDRKCIQGEHVAYDCACMYTYVHMCSCANLPNEIQRDLKLRPFGGIGPLLP